MKIKTTKQMRLDELIKYVWENDITSHHFFSTFEQHFFVNSDGEVILNNLTTKDSAFPVEVEEELTEETEFDSLWELYYDTIDKKPGTYVNFHTSVSKILDENSIDEDNATLAIYHKDTLIWSRDTGIPEEGVIEV